MIWLAYPIATIDRGKYDEMGGIRAALIDCILGCVVTNFLICSESLWRTVFLRSFNFRGVFRIPYPANGQGTLNWLLTLGPQPLGKRPIDGINRKYNDFAETR